MLINEKTETDNFAACPAAEQVATTEQDKMKTAEVNSLMAKLERRATATMQAPS